MSIEYCQKCSKYIDTDFNTDHFDKEVDCCETKFEAEQARQDDIQENTDSLEEKLEALNNI